jgi:hypothetical protein
MKKAAISVAAVLAVAMILGVGLAVLPVSLQEAQANPCSFSNGDLTVAAASTVTEEEGDDEIEVLDCDLTGVVIDEDSVQEAEANPCFSTGNLVATAASTNTLEEGDDEIEVLDCDLTGVVIDDDD